MQEGVGRPAEAKWSSVLRHVQWHAAFGPSASEDQAAAVPRFYVRVASYRPCWLM